jgi:tRNA 2-thiouridine synthesizing protein A
VPILAPEPPVSPRPEVPVAPDGAAILDLCGEVCPFTFVRARLGLEAMAIGTVLRVLVDHAPAARNVPRSARAWGQAVDAVRDLGDGRWEITLRKQVE